MNFKNSFFFLVWGWGGRCNKMDDLSFQGTKSETIFSERYWLLIEEEG